MKNSKKDLLKRKNKKKPIKDMDENKEIVKINSSIMEEIKREEHMEGFILPVEESWLVDKLREDLARARAELQKKEEILKKLNELKAKKDKELNKIIEEANRIAKEKAEKDLKNMAPKSNKNIEKNKE
ncbi:MAG: hypothetical protein ACTSU2_07585 [Promethearchaeota archaeon]